MLKRNKKNLIIVVLIAFLIGFINGKLRDKGFFGGISQIHFSAIQGAIVGALSVFIFNKTKDS